MQLPELNTRTLQGVAKTLPADLPAQRTLVVVAFQQRQQRDVDQWLAVAEKHGWLTDLTQAQEQLPAYAAIEIPCLSRRWEPVRRFIDGGMSTGIGVPVVLARTWTAYTDVKRVQRALDLRNGDQVWAGAVSRDGQVLAHSMGLPTPTTVTTLTTGMTQD